MAVRIHPQAPPILSPASEQGYVGQVLTALIDAVKYIWAQALGLIEGIFHCATCGRFAPAMPPVTDLAQPPQVTESSPTPLVGETDLVAMRSRDQYPLGGLITETIQLIFLRCLSKGRIKAFKALSRTNVHSYVTMRKLVNEVALTVLCPKLRILDARTYKFQADLVTIDKYNALQSYYKLEPFVENHAGFTIVFNHGSLTLKDMKENKCGIIVDVIPNEISEELDNVPEEGTEPEMISNAPITETRGNSPESQETRVRDEVGFDGKPTLIHYLALKIADQNKSKTYNQNELKRYLDGNVVVYYGRSSIQVRGFHLVVGRSFPDRVTVQFDDVEDWIRNANGAEGRRKL